MLLIERENLRCMRYKLLFVNPKIPTNENLSEDDNNIKRIATVTILYTILKRREGQ